MGTLNSSQIRYYGAGNNKNFPATLTKEQLINGQLWSKTDFSYIFQLGVQTLPGVQFSIAQDPAILITIGSTGIYEINVENFSTIETIKFTSESIDLIDSNPTTFLIIDVIGVKGSGGVEQ